MGITLLFMRMANRFVTKIRRIFLTEITMRGKTFAGPNIIAETFALAEEAAEQNGLVLVGELDSIVVDDVGNSSYTNIPIDETIH